ncbi:glycosyltransferase family 4 protein [Clostridium sp. C105KSO13]|uniref:glycosyltransferase family 4 protein n=1 Tax=Clostridium sp. C105KSO13 TaxID=1776045 RepID=UPI00074085DD|nr:glycosyltransferase family 4 protein [Clostridium sp. C105KSO13]CUX33608.1 GDP-mannose-dependent alpha-(1-6)-phosphatidylinositol monomannoside mannosyltransferase [Clostridium sp. C105KSO13]
MRKAYCIFSAQYLPHMGGVERYTYNLAKKLIELGNTVTVVTSNLQNLPEYERMNDISIYRLPAFNLLDGRYPVLKCNGDFKKLHHRLKQEKFDFVIVNTRFYIHSVYGQWFAKTCNIQVITIDHGSSHLTVGNPIFDALGGAYEHVITKIGQMFCKDYYGVSKACIDWLKHFHIKAKGILYNSVDVETIEEILKKNEKKYRAAYGIDENALVITFTGRLLPEKGVPQLISAFEKIQERYENTYLFLAGDGPLEEFASAHKSTHLIPLGRQSFEKVLVLLSETDIFCLPSFSEGFSTSILEAIVCRCYVVTTERGGARETFPTDEYGTVIPDNDVGILTKALANAMNSPAKREKAVKLSYSRLKDNFTWDIVAERVNKLL